MMHCKKLIISLCFTASLVPLTVWSEAPVVDDSDNFAIIEEQEASQRPLVNSKYDDPQFENNPASREANNRYSNGQTQYNQTQYNEEPALVRDDNQNSSSKFNDNAKLIDKIQSLQQQIQELRGQLEVQAHDLKLLQQQQIAFYKDLDNRLGTSTSKSTTLPNPVAQVNEVPANKPALPVTPQQTQAITSPVVVKPVNNVSRANPADEQISYLAAYELIKSKRYDDAVNAMQTFANKYPNGGYTANAEYWLGELYLLKKQYKKSIEHFEVVLNQFPSSSKSAASMLKDGYAFAALGDNKTARIRLQQVVKTYPDTPSAQLAASKLATLNAL